MAPFPSNIFHLYSTLLQDPHLLAGSPPSSSSVPFFTILAHGATVYVPQTNQWECGYCNFRMLLSALSAIFLSFPSSSSSSSFSPLPSPSPRSTSAVQKLLEDSWRDGSDPSACRYFSSALVGKQGESGYTGAADFCCLLRHLGVSCNVETFGNVPDLLHFCRDYFTDTSTALMSGSPVLQRSVPPLFLQREGHSRTIVGVSYAPADNVVRLVLFDPRAPDAPVVVMGEDVLEKEVRDKAKKVYQVIHVLRERGGGGGGKVLELGAEEASKFSRNVKLVCCD